MAFLKEVHVDGLVWSYKDIARAETAELPLASAVLPSTPVWQGVLPDS